MTATPETLPEFARLWVDLAQPRLGAAAIHATDEFFAPKERMIDPDPLQRFDTPAVLARVEEIVDEARSAAVG